MVAARTRESIKGWAHRDRRSQRAATRDKFRIRSRAESSTAPEPQTFKPVEPPAPALQAQVFRPTPQHQTPRELDPRKVSLERLRWDTVSILRNTHYSYEDVHARGGPCVQTLTKLVDGTTKNPHLGTLISTLQVCGCDLYVAPARGAKKN
jgi:hypothetical protein